MRARFVKTHRPDLRQVAIVGRGGHAFAGVESEDLDVDFEKVRDFASDRFQRQQAFAVGDAELNDGDGGESEKLGLARRVKCSAGVLRARPDSIVSAERDGTHGKATPEGRGFGERSEGSQ